MTKWNPNTHERRDKHDNYEVSYTIEREWKKNKNNHCTALRNNPEKDIVQSSNKQVAWLTHFLEHAVNFITASFSWGTVQEPKWQCHPKGLTANRIEKMPKQLWLGNCNPHISEVFRHSLDDTEASLANVATAESIANAVNNSELTVANRLCRVHQMYVVFWPLKIC